MSVELYPYQEFAVSRLKNGNILNGGVGSGKSITSLVYFYNKVCHGDYKVLGELKTPKDLYIITTARKRDELEWDKECAKLGIFKDDNSSISHVKLVIDSWNNISKYSKVKDAFFIFDEQRAIGRGKWSRDFIKISKSNEWILLSATPGDTWSDYIPVFIANGFYKNRTEFCREHIVFSRFSRYPKIERYLGIQKLKQLRSKILVPMDNKRKTVRHFVDISIQYDKDSYNQIHKDRWNIFTNEPIEDAAACCYAERRVVNSNPQRLDKLFEIYSLYKKIIVFYNFDYELEMLRTYLDDKKIVYAEWNGHRHQQLPSSKQWVYLVQYRAGAEAWNCISTNCMVFYSLDYSYKIMEQAAGRIDRVNTPYKDLYYFRFLSESSIDKSIFRTIKCKKKFNELDYFQKKG